MNFNDLKSKISTWLHEGTLTKIVLIALVGAFALVPVMSIQKKMQTAMGNQPVIITVMYASMMVLLLIFVFVIFKTRHRRKN